MRNTATTAYALAYLNYDNGNVINSIKFICQVSNEVLN